MSRFENTPALFGNGMGFGISGNVTCQWCGTDYIGREDEEGVADLRNDSIRIDNFGNKQICDCCFEMVEEAIIEAMPQILPWYIRILESRKADLGALFSDMESIKNLLKELAEKPHHPI